MSLIQTLAKVLGVYRPAVPCSVDVARIRELTDMITADGLAIPVTHS